VGDRDRIISFGDLIDDVVAIPLGAIRDDTDTPSSIRSSPGGSAANTAAWLGSLGAAVDFVGASGASDLARHEAVFAAAGVTPHLSPTALPTGTIVVIVEGDRRHMLTERGANAALDPAAVTDELLAGATVLHLTGHTLLNHAGAEGIAALIARARAAGVTVSVAPGSAGFIADYGVEPFLAGVAGADILFPNLDEGRVLTGLDEAGAIAERLAESFGTVVLTAGSAGALVAHGGSVTSVPAVVADAVIDPTGAGDAFCAGYLAHWVASGDPVAAAREGALVASRAVGLIGGRPSV
jgi:sugar/nucleoside kinase (ribokinase family)